MATHSIAVHIGPGRMTVGYYTIENGELRMLGPDGDVVKTHKLRPEDNAKVLAGIFTKEIRKTMRSELVEGFNDPIDMPELGIV